MMLAQADIKYGPTLPIGKNGKGVKTYLSAVIDDHSRLILDSGFYVGQEQEIVEDTLRRAILKHGKMDAAYFDNGRQYISKQLKIALSKLGIRIIHCKPYSPASKGYDKNFVM
jgi:transposase InsO family protein